MEIFEEENEIDEDLVPLLRKLEAIADEAGDIYFNQDHLTYRDVTRLQNKLHIVDEQYSQGGFKNHDGKGQALLADALEETHDFVRKLVLNLNEDDQWENVDPALIPVIKQLQKVLDKLHALKMRHEIRYKDIAKLQGWLHRIDLKFRELPASLEADGSVSKMLADAFALVEDLVDNMLPPEVEDVSPKFRRIFKKLRRIRNALNDAESVPISLLSTRYVGTLQSRLSKIDEKYTQARFSSADEIPKGQAVLADMLEEAHFIARDLLCKIEDFEQSKDEILPISSPKQSEVFEESRENVRS
jgi:hypothetical protein